MTVRKRIPFLRVGASRNFYCPKHGNLGKENQAQLIESTITGYEGKWCEVCHVEWMDRNLMRVNTPRKDVVFGNELRRGSE